MKDLRGFELPKKPVVRFGSDGYRVKVWYRNGSGMLWMWTFYFTDPKPTLTEALEEAQRVADEAAEQDKRRRETENAFWKAMARQTYESVKKRFPSESDPMSDEIVITQI